MVQVLSRMVVITNVGITHSKSIRYLMLTLSNLRVIFSKAYSVIECASCHRGMSRTAEILHKMSDKELRDIGITRGEIYSRLKENCKGCCK